MKIYILFNGDVISVVTTSKSYFLLTARELMNSSYAYASIWCNEERIFSHSISEDNLKDIEENY